ncbi:hypothetical protein DFH28DRAFT_1123095 [Melampsora americana]|nr:hypothetical protein DFH28DRAFT_1123095 [Melampsora americana]
MLHLPTIVLHLALLVHLQTTYYHSRLIPTPPANGFLCQPISPPVVLTKPATPISVVSWPIPTTCSQLLHGQESAPTPLHPTVEGLPLTCPPQDPRSQPLTTSLPPPAGLPMYHLFRRHPPEASAVTIHIDILNIPPPARLLSYQPDHHLPRPTTN